MKHFLILIMVPTLLVLGCGETLSTQLNAENNEERVEQLSGQNQEFKEKLNEQENKIAELKNENNEFREAEEISAQNQELEDEFSRQVVNEIIKKLKNENNEERTEALDALLNAENNKERVDDLSDLNQKLSDELYRLENEYNNLRNEKNALTNELKTQITLLKGEITNLNIQHQMELDSQETNLKANFNHESGNVEVGHKEEVGELKNVIGYLETQFYNTKYNFADFKRWSDLNFCRERLRDDSGNPINETTEEIRERCAYLDKDVFFKENPVTIDKWW
jgi:chromosome segregation ATPase